MNNVAKKAKYERRFKSRLTVLSKALLCGLVASSALLGGSAYAQLGASGGISGERVSTVRMPNADFVERVIDLRVKVLGGEIKFERSWVDGSWRMNEAWSNLIFYYEDPEFIPTPRMARSASTMSTRSGVVIRPPTYENKIRHVSRAGTMYEVSDDNDDKDVDIYVEMSNGQSFIRRTKNEWRWFDREGNWISYDKDGRLLAYGDRNGINVTFVRDGDARRMGVKDHHGNTVLSFTYDDERLTSVTDNTGRQVTYHWEGNLLTSVTDVEGNTWGYGYDKKGNLIQRTEPDGATMRITNHGETEKRSGTQLNSQRKPVYIYPQRQTTANTLYSSGSSRGSASAGKRLNVLSIKREQTDEKAPARTGSITATNGATTIFNIDYNRSAKEYAVSQIDELGKNTTEVYDNNGKLLSRSINGDLVLTRQYGSNNSSIKSTDERGLSTSVNYNEARKPTRITHPDGSVETYTYDNTFNKPLTYVNQLGIITEWTYDDKGNALTRIDAKGKEEQRFNSWTYDGYGQALTYTIASGDGTGSDAITTSYTYDANGNIKTMTDPMGNTTEYTYNNQGQVTSVTNALNHTWHYAYTGQGHLKTITNPLGDSVHVEIDNLGRPVKIIDAKGQSATVAYNYNNFGFAMTKTDAVGYATAYQFNLQNRLASVIFPSGDKVEQTYDSKGRLEQRIDPAGNITKTQYGTTKTLQANMPANMIYPAYQENYQYNSLGLPIEVTQFVGESEELKTSMSYNALGMLLSMTQPNGAVTQLQYDAFGNQTKHIDALGSTTQQTYDVFGNVTSVVDAKGNTHRFEYDRNGNLVKEFTPSGQVTTYSYDVVGQLTGKQDAAGNIARYEYNAVGLVVKEVLTAAGQSAHEQTIHYSFDKNGQLLETTKVSGRSGDINTHHKFTRDELGRIVREDITYGNGVTAVSKTLRYDYDADGRRVSITYPDGSVQAATYEQGRLTQIQRPDGKEITQGAYEWMRPTQVNAPSVKQVLSYDALQRTASIEARNQSNIVLLQRGYAYDKAGNIIARNTEDGEYTYGYDQLSRLKQVNPPQSAQDKGLPVESYAYDAVHNRVGSSHQAGEWLYDQDNQLLKFGAGSDETSFAYTANGHVQTETKNGVTKTYTYDAADRLVSVTQKVAGVETEIVRYAYDPFGRRISKTVHGETTYFVYSQEGLIAELNEGGDIIRAYGWELNSMYGTAPLWQAEVSNNKVNTAQFHTLITDHLGTPQMAVNDAGNITWKAVSESFGKTLPDTQNQITMNLRFPGQYFDEETSSHYNYFRDYNSTTGRYLQKDPIGLYAGINWFGYSFMNVLNKIDIYGMESICERAVREGYNIGRDGSKHGGGVMCNDGEMTPCDFDATINPPKSMGFIIISDCTIEHEKVHFPQSACAESGFYRAPFKDKDENETWEEVQGRGECEAYRADLDCLEKSISRCEGSVACEAVVRSFMMQRKENINGFCGRVNMLTGAEFKYSRLKGRRR